MRTNSQTSAAGPMPRALTSGSAAGVPGITDSPSTWVDDPAETGRWMAIDWAMKALSMAMHLCAVAKMDDIARELEQMHKMAQKRRDRSS